MAFHLFEGDRGRALDVRRRSEEALEFEADPSGM